MPTYIYRYVTKPKAKKQSLLLIITICNAKATLRPSARNKNAKQDIVLSTGLKTIICKWK